MSYIVGWYYLRPSEWPEQAPRQNLMQVIGQPLSDPVILLVMVVIGSMYFGWATATEAAAVGVVGALLLAASQKSLTFETFTQS